LFISIPLMCCSYLHLSGEDAEMFYLFLLIAKYFGKPIE
jgi:hypothetical protein